MLKSDCCVLCRGGVERDGGVVGYVDGGSAHFGCIEEKVCVFCGCSGLCQRCTNRDCQRTYHSHCFRQYFPNNEQTLFCDIHRKSKGKRKECQRLWLTRQVSGRVNLEESLIKTIKEKYHDSKYHTICSGQVFWYFIGSQYFPKSISLKKPEIQVRAKIDFSDSCLDLDCFLTSIEAEYNKIQSQNLSILSETQIPEEIHSEFLKDLKEDELILWETRNLLLKDGFESYLKYFESKIKEETDGNSNTEKRTSSLREVPKNEEDFVCSICCDGDYEDDDLIVICSFCEIGAHMKCYGIPVVPEGDWVCHGCKFYPNKEQRSSISCALCPIKGGCIKPTIHYTQGTLSFPNYPEGQNVQVWCHIFCAFHIDIKVFKDPDFLDSIDLRVIDSKRFNLRCCICKTKDGACLQCQYGRCQTAFHPECAKDFFTNTRDKTGYDEVAYYCPIHKPLKLRRVLEGKEKKSVEDVVSFCKAFERLEKKMKNPVVVSVVKKVSKAERPFSCEEKFKLIEVLENELEKVKKGNTKEFAVMFKIKSGSLRNRVETIRPEAFNIIDPETILLQKLSIKGRKPLECYKFYQDFLYPLMKQELEVQRFSPVSYYPKAKRPQKKKREKSSKRLKATEKPLQLLPGPVIPLEDVVTKEVYCICQKPFVEKSSRKQWESELDYSKRTDESKMIQCEFCDEWYHYKCIGITSLSIPESYKCQKCLDNSLLSSN